MAELKISKVEAPDGSIIKVEHPANATQEEIISNAEILWGRKQEDARFEEQQRQIRLQRLRIEKPEEFNPKSKAFQERFGPASRGATRNLLAGSGKAFVDIGRGTQQLGVEAANLLPGVDLEEQKQALRERSTDVRERDAQLMGTGAGLAGNIGTNVGLALTPGQLASGTGKAANLARAFSAPATLPQAAGSGALFGAIQPVAEDESRAFNVGAGVLGGTIGHKLSKPFSQNLSRGQASAVETLSASGVPLDVAERTGSTAAQRLANMLDDSVISAGSREAFKDTQRRAFTRAVLETIGESAEEATPQVMNSARNRIGSVFRDVARQRGGVTADDVLLTDASRIYRAAQNALLGDEMRLFDKNFRNIMGGIDGGAIAPSKFNSALSDLGNISKRQNIGQFASELEDSLIDALARSAPDDVLALNAARAQWRNLRIIQGAVGKGEERFISPLRLSGTLGNKANQNLSVFGLGRQESRELSDLARAGREILKESPNSGTALRQQLPTIGGGTLAASAGGVPGLLGYAGAVRGASGAMNSQGLLGNYLTTGLPDTYGAPLTQALIRSALQQQSKQLEE